MTQDGEPLTESQYLIEELDALISLLKRARQSAPDETIQNLEAFKVRVNKLTAEGNSSELSSIQDEVAAMTFRDPDLYRAWRARDSELTVSTGSQILIGFDAIARNRSLTTKELQDRERVIAHVRRANNELRDFLDPPTG